MEDHQHGAERGQGSVRCHGDGVRKVPVLPVPTRLFGRNRNLHISIDIAHGGSGKMLLLYYSYQVVQLCVI